jgi:4-amino-4-deoxy-L-arabinose transferase-like glycosyltransferase
MVGPKNKKNLLTLVLLLLLSIPAVLALVHVGFFPTHDFIYIARINEMAKSLLDGQFPVRWVSGFRYGDPTFNFYGPLPYYLGAIFHFLGLGFLDTAKLLFGLSLILSFLTMYLLGKELFGKWGGILSSALYLYAPYRSVDVYVRGTLNEAWAFVFFPLIFLYAIKLTKKISLHNIALLALSLAGLFYTHNVMTVLFIPFFGLFCLFQVFYPKFNKKLTLSLILSFVLGIFLAASYLLPAYFEKKFVQTSYLTVGYFDFAGHFVAIKQWFTSPWGYGASLWGPEDDMSFQLGIVQWIVLALILVFVLIAIFRKKLSENRESFKYLMVFISLFILSLFLQHNKSTFIWQTFPILAYTQFPWRFLALSVFFAALIGGWLVKILERPRLTKAAVIICLAFLVAVNFSFFKPKEYYSDSIDEHYMGEGVLSKDDKIPKDYLPIWVKEIPKEKITTPLVVSGDITTYDFYKNSHRASFRVESSFGGRLEIPITYFPGWQASMDGNKIQLLEPSDKGLISLEVPGGKHNVEIWFGNTLIRTLGNLLSLLGFLFILLIKTKVTFKFYPRLLKWISVK